MFKNAEFQNHSVERNIERKAERKSLYQRPRRRLRLVQQGETAKIVLLALNADNSFAGAREMIASAGHVFYEVGVFFQAALIVVAIDYAGQQ